MKKKLQTIDSNDNDEQKLVPSVNRHFTLLNLISFLILVAVHLCCSTTIVALFISRIVASVFLFCDSINFCDSTNLCDLSCIAINVFLPQAR
jgi:hypothetical protein